MTNQKKFRAITWATFSGGLLLLLVGVLFIFPILSELGTMLFLLGWAGICIVGLFFGYKFSRNPDVKREIDTERETFMQERYEKNPNALMFKGMYGADGSVPKYVPKEKEAEIFEMTEK